MCVCVLCVCHSGVQTILACVQVCLHPEVSQYISSVCQSVRSLLVQGAVQRVDVVLITSAAQPLERFVFDLSHTTTDTG